MVAGEASGDLYGARLALALRERAPGIHLYGIGGREMERAGVELLWRCEELAVVGIVEAMTKLPQVVRAYRTLRASLADRPSLAILIDYPGFNLPLAKALKKRGIPVLYYVSPQVWAWRPGRARKMGKRVDRLAVILPFEVEFFKRYGIEATFVGHPLQEVLAEVPRREEARRRLGLREDERVVAILPGSRPTEVKKLLTPMVEASEILRRGMTDLRFLLALAPSLKREVLPPLEPWVEIVEGRPLEVMASSDVMMVASGTATLQGALLGIPMVILYRVNPISYLLGRLLVRVEHIGLPNLLRGRRVVPELIQGEVKPERIAEEVKRLLLDREAREGMRREFEEIGLALEGDASQRVAELAMELMGEN